MHLFKSTLMIILNVFFHFFIYFKIFFNSFNVNFMNFLSKNIKNLQRTFYEKKRKNYNLKENSRKKQIFYNKNN